MGWRGIWEHSLAPEAGSLGTNSPVAGGLGAKPSALRDFCNFSIKITRFMHISAKTHQLKAFGKQSKRTE